MTKKVEETEPEMAHFLAYCTESGCKFVEDDYQDPARYDRIRKHVRSTGHTVKLEQGLFSEFYLED